jgi:hypothetical protein
VRLSDGGEIRPSRGGDEHPGDHARRRAIRLHPDVEERYLADGGGHVTIVRRRGERVAATHGRSESRDPLRVDPGERACVRDRRPPVVELARGVEQVRLAPAVPEAAMVEHERRDARGREALGERPEAIAPRPRQAVGHDDDRGGRRRAGGWVEPGGAGVGAGGEVEVSTVHAATTPPAGRM